MNSERTRVKQVSALPLPGVLAAGVLEQSGLRKDDVIIACAGKIDTVSGSVAVHRRGGTQPEIEIPLRSEDARQHINNFNFQDLFWRR
jgi:hypothetical protein